MTSDLSEPFTDTPASPAEDSASHNEARELAQKPLNKKVKPPATAAHTHTQSLFEPFTSGCRAPCSCRCKDLQESCCTVSGQRFPGSTHLVVNGCSPGYVGSGSKRHVPGALQDVAPGVLWLCAESICIRYLHGQ